MKNKEDLNHIIASNLNDWVHRGSIKPKIAEDVLDGIKKIKGILGDRTTKDDKARLNDLKIIIEGLSICYRHQITVYIKTKVTGLYNEFRNSIKNDPDKHIDELCPQEIVNFLKTLDESLISRIFPQNVYSSDTFDKIRQSILEDSGELFINAVGNLDRRYIPFVREELDKLISKSKNSSITESEFSCNWFNMDEDKSSKDCISKLNEFAKYMSATIGDNKEESLHEAYARSLLNYLEHNWIKGLKNKILKNTNEHTKSSHITNINRLPFPSTIKGIDGEQKRMNFLTNLYSEFGNKLTSENKEPLSKECFQYLFGLGSHKSIPANYPKKILWNDQKQKFAILLAVLYETSDRRLANNFIGWIKDNRFELSIKWSEALVRDVMSGKNKPSRVFAQSILKIIKDSKGQYDDTKSNPNWIKDEWSQIA